MNWFTYCRNSKCLKNNECERFVMENPPNENVINFRHICNEKNGYYLRIEKASSDLVPTEGGEKE